jgi:hypothetical protein
MSNTVGKITGQMLENNLVRRDMQTAGSIDEDERPYLSFDNTSITDNILYLDVFDSRIGIKTDGPLLRQLNVNSDINATNFTVDDLFTFQDWEFANNVITNTDGNITIQSSQPISAAGIATEGILIDAGFIKSRRSNEDIDLIPAGTGSIQFYSDVKVNANLHATGDITFDGSITIGDGNEDSVTFAADLAGDLIPDSDLAYNLGSLSNKFQSISTVLVNGINYNTGSTVVAGIDLSLRPGKIWFVAENGDNAFTGDHENGPFSTIEYALSQSTSGDTVFIYPGTYMEYWPLTIPAGVTVKGSGIRATKIIPQAATNDQDAFLFNGETSISDITISNFFYNSVTDTGYAFRFANNFNVTSRSPYIQNISVITENESSLASAGRGACIDGSVANAASKEASMLFHSATFITPGADCLVMKNGVRVEWLNSFIYYANKGLYAENGALGFASLGLKYGAEVRSIGSANVYGNYGAWADGDEVLMYLINHNFGYIGADLDNNNDPTDTNQANEVVTLNDGKIYYQSVDHKGDFRVGDFLLIESNTGDITFNATNVTANNLTVTDGTNTSFVDSQEVTNNNITISGNTIQSTVGGISLNPFNTTLSISSNFTGTSSTVTGNLSVPNNVTFGDNNTYNTNFNSTFGSSIIPNTGFFELGADNKKWLTLFGSSFLFEDIIIDTSVIRTTLSNSNLELKANGVGFVNITDSTIIDQTLIVNGIANLSNTNIIGNIISDNLNISNTLTATKLYSDNILIEDNFITTTLSNSSLELRADGTGVVNVTDSAIIDQNLTVNGITSLSNTNIIGNITSGIVNISNTLTATKLYSGDILIEDNFITTTLSNSNLELRANGTGIVNVTDSLIIDQNLTVSGMSSLRNTTLNSATITGFVTATNLLQAPSFQTDDIYIDDNFITTTLSNSNLELRANGTGFLLIDEVLKFSDGEISNILVSGSESLRSITLTPFTNQSVVINSNQALKFPIGNNTNRVLSTTGQVRFNNSLNNFEGRITGGNRNFYGLFDSDANTGITAELTPGANDNTIRMIINGITQATLTQEKFTVNNRISVDQIRLDSNIISTFNSNADLELDRSGTGVVQFKDDFSITDNIITNLKSNGITSIVPTGMGYVRFVGNSALGVPSGTTLERPVGIPMGATRYNVDLGYLEIYDGSNWVISAGGGAAISTAEMEDISDEWALIFG